MWHPEREKIFSMESLKRIKPGFGNEIQLTDAISMLLKVDEVFGLKYKAEKFDCGSREGFIHANIHFARKQKIII